MKRGTINIQTIAIICEFVFGATNTRKAIMASGITPKPTGMVVVMVVGIIMKAFMGQQQFKNAEGQGLDLVISTAVCAVGLILFSMIFFANNRERVPFTQEKVSIKDAIKVVFGNKNLLMVSLTKRSNL